MRNALLALAAACWLASAVPAQKPSPDPYAHETTAQRDARMKWWREARFGMFIHWGVYSVPAGVYHGQEIGSIGEWIMNTAKIPVAEYRSFATQFNPVNYNADTWVKLAKAAGMKYIIITSKHHDGFAMFDSKASDWNIVKASPFGRDPLKELAAACKRHGMRLGFYYSQAQDWTNPGGAAIGGRWDKAQEGDMDAYVRNVAVKQVQEILTHYGKISVLWWDTPADINQERADALIPLLKLQPGIIHNNRLGIYRGDSETPEQFVPATGYPGRDWETCMTMNDTWGYKSTDHNWKPVTMLLRNLIDIASKGGNYLLNVGPTNLGEIPGPSVERLQAIGEWMKSNGQAIYATQPSPFRKLPWGRCTRKVSAGGTTLYLHVFDWPADGKLLVPGLRNDPIGASLLVGGRKLTARKTEDGVVLDVPLIAPNSISTTIALRIAGAAKVENPGLLQAQDGTVTLHSSEATIHGSQAQYESGDRRDNIGFWLDPNDWVEWGFKVTKPGRFTVVARIATNATARFTVKVGDQSLACQSPDTGDYGEFKAVELGVVEIAAAGPATLSVRPVVDGWQPMNLKDIRLVPAR